MGITGIIGTAKVIAKMIESKFPGTCTGIIKDLDKASIHPVLIKQRVENLRDLWNNYKDAFAKHEVDALSAKAGFDLSDPSTWDSFLDSTSIAETVTDIADSVSDGTDVVDAVESSGGIIGSILEFITDLLS